MRKNFMIILLIAMGLQFSACSTEKLTDYVDPGIGTVHSRWFFYTPGAVPFGMAKLGPSTNGSYGNEQGWEAVGYDGRHNPHCRLTSIIVLKFC